VTEGEETPGARIARARRRHLRCRLDLACWILRLTASGGHTAPEAERQASRLPAFQAADPAHIDLFAAANVRLWGEIAQSSSVWTKDIAQATDAWLASRQAEADAVSNDDGRLGHSPGGDAQAAPALAFEMYLPLTGHVPGRLWCRPAREYSSCACGVRASW
jgi:hypothetical protein